MEWLDWRMLYSLIPGGGIFAFLNRQKIGKFIESGKNLIVCESEKTYLADTLARILAQAGTLENSPYSQLLNSVQKSKSLLDEETLSPSSLSGSGQTNPQTGTSWKRRSSDQMSLNDPLQGE